MLTISNLIYREHTIAILTAISVVLTVIISILFYKFSALRRLYHIQSKNSETYLEEAIHRTTLEERRKIGQDLHDGFLGFISGILYHIDEVKSKTSENELHTELSDLYTELNLVYKQIREKSHLNFNAIYDINEDFLDNSIQKIANSILKSNIKKEVEIDKQISVLLSTYTRLEILRIIQEALTNIAKHAKKTTEVFIYLYKIEEIIYLEIGNNDSSSFKPNGIGILSIISRVQMLGGEIEIKCEKGGFLIEIKLFKEGELQNSNKA